MEDRDAANNMAATIKRTAAPFTSLQPNRLQAEKPLGLSRSSGFGRIDRHVPMAVDIGFNTSIRMEPKGAHHPAGGIARGFDERLMRETLRACRRKI